MDFKFRRDGTTDYCHRASKKLMSLSLFSVAIAIDMILFKLASIKDMHKILDEFEFQPDI